MVEVGSNLFQFKFTTKFDMEQVLRDGPWMFDNQILMLRKWQPGMTATNVKFDSVALWVQIWGAPFDMVCPQVAAAVGRRLGVVEEVEQRRRKDIQNMFMRVKVAIPIAKPLRRGGFLSGSDGQRVWTTFKYERLPLFCHFCGLLGHDLKHCAGYFALVKKENEVQCPYGEWLKASGGRPWASFKRDPDRSYYPRSGTEKGNGEVEDSGDEVAATHNYSPNPSLHEKREERFSENLGSAQDTGVVIAKNQGGRSINGRLETDIDWLDMDGIGCDNSNLQLTSEINEAETFPDKQGISSVNVKDDLSLDNSLLNERRSNQKLGLNG